MTAQITYEAYNTLPDQANLNSLLCAMYQRLDYLPVTGRIPSARKYLERHVQSTWFHEACISGSKEGSSVHAQLGRGTSRASVVNATDVEAAVEEDEKARLATCTFRPPCLILLAPTTYLTLCFSFASLTPRHQKHQRRDPQGPHDVDRRALDELDSAHQLRLQRAAQGRSPTPRWGRCGRLLPLADDAAPTERAPFSPPGNT
jgi:hypothetical protein